MKIDLHCHTIKVKTGEDSKRNVTKELFKEKVIEADVKIIAITNHNIFDKEQFNDFYNHISGEFLLLPGIELDIIGQNKEIGHVVVIYDNTDIDFFDKKVKRVMDFKEEQGITIKKFIEFVNSLDCLVILHFFKPKSLEQSSIKYIKENIINSYRLFYEPSSYKTANILMNHDLKVLMGSDHSDWENYEKNEFLELKLEVNSYHNLYRYISKDEQVVNSLLEKEDKHLINIAYSNDKNELVSFYNDFNVIFGSKGTGKTEALKKVKKHFDEQGRTGGIYIPDENKIKIKDMLKIMPEERKLSKYGRNNFINNFVYLSNYTDRKVIELNDYINYVKYRGNNKNKDKIKIITINERAKSSEKIDKNILNEYNKITQVINLLNSLKLDNYLSEFDKIQMMGLVEKIQISVKHKFEEKVYDDLSVIITNKTVDIIKSIVEKKTLTKSIPTQSGLKDFISKRYELEIKIRELLESFDLKIEIPSQYICELEENKKLFLGTKISMLSEDSVSKDGFLEILKLKTIKKYFNSILENIYFIEIFDLLNFKEEYKDNQNLSLDNFLGIKKHFIVGKNKNYKPSTGEETIIILEQFLRSKFDYFIMDEPEKSLGNNYVNDVLLPQLVGLANQKKTIVIATHNANLAVRTLPKRTVLKVYDSGVYKTYVGGPFTNKLVNIEDIKDVKNWKEKSMKILEGGKEAFIERGDLYEVTKSS